MPKSTAAGPVPTEPRPQLPSDLSTADLVMVAVVFIWGASYSVIKGAYHEIPAVAFLGMRFAIAGAAMLPVLWWQRRNLPSTREGWWAAFTVGVSGVAAYQILFSIGLQYTTASNSTLLISTGPAFTALFAPLLGLGRLRREQVLGIPASLLGVYLLSAAARGGWGWDWGHGRGDLLSLGAAIATGLGFALGGKYLGGRTGVATMSLAVVLGSLMIIPFSWKALTAHPWGATSTGAWLAVLYASLVAAAAGYVLWYHNIGRLGAVRGSVYGFFIPVVGVTLAVIFLGEPLRLLELTGAAFVLAGVALARGWVRLW